MTALAPASPPSLPAARSPRGQRARDGIADALLALLREGDLRATAPRIAARAGVSLRTVFHHFPDLEALHQAAAARQAAAVRALMAPLDASLPLAERVGAFARQRAKVLEFIAPVRRAALLHEPTSPAVAAAIDAVRAGKRAQTLATFARELRGAGPELGQALAAITSFSFWSALRHEQGLSPARAQRALAAAIHRLLGGAP